MKREVWLLRTGFGIVPVNKLVSLTWLLCALRSFRRFTLHHITFQNIKFLHDTFFLLSSYFHTHPITLLLEIFGGRMHGPSPTSNFGRTVPQSPLSLRP